ncbi:MAG: HEPN domain-containing protein [Thermodesulfobacteriota bacterium]
MKAENSRKNSQEEMTHAEESLRAARVLMENQLFREALPKLYYVVFHSLRSLLFSIGLEPRSHEGISHLFHLHFVKPGLFPVATHRFFKRLMKYRHDAEYGLGFQITEKDCTEWLVDVVSLTEEIKKYLRSQIP